MMAMTLMQVGTFINFHNLLNFVNPCHAVIAELQLSCHITLKYVTIQNSKESSLQLSMYVITSVIYVIGNVPLTKRVPQTFEKIAQHTHSSRSCSYFTT